MDCYTASSRADRPVVRAQSLELLQAMDDTVPAMDHGRPHQVMCELRDPGAELRRFREVPDRDHGTKRITNPVGEPVPHVRGVTVPNAPDQRLCTCTAPKGSETERKLREPATKFAVLV